MTRTDEVESRFLKDVDRWHGVLAASLFEANTGFAESTLSESAGKILDSILFERLCQSRGISNLSEFELINGAADSEDRGPMPVIEKRALEKIRRELQDARGTDQDCTVLGPDVLGRVYERFLDKHTQRSLSKSASETSSRKKAAGIFYTPDYVVDYIVDNTVGKLLSGRTPGEVARLRILDPACGCGSFLIGAYRKLLDWHVDWYIAAGRSAAGSALVRANNGEWQLSIDVRKRILLNNLFGVDLDPRAIEIAKQSLLVLLLEGIDRMPADHWRGVSFDSLLDQMNGNIKRGNSLTGRGFIEHCQTGSLNHTKLDPDAFDWPVEFPHVGLESGFDTVIGNPPYRRELDFKPLLDEIARTRLGAQYRMPRMDLWYYFLHRGLELLKPSGCLSFITNAYWLSGSSAEKLIQTLRDSAHVDEIFHLQKLKVFRNVAGLHTIFRISSSARDAPTTIKLVESGQQTSAKPFVTGMAPVIEFSKSRDELFRHGRIDLQPAPPGLLSKIERGVALSELGIVRQGIAENPSAINRKTNQKHNNRWRIGQGVFALTPEEVARLKLPETERTLLRPYYDLCDLGRYELAQKPSRDLIYSTRKTCPDIDRFPAIREHLGRFRPILDVRRETRNGKTDWWHLHWPRDEQLWQSAKIVAVQMSVRPAFVPTQPPVYVPFSTNVFVPDDATREHLYFITGVLNSRLMWKWYQHHAKQRGVGLEINGRVLARSPIHRIDFAKPDNRRQHANLVQLVERMLELQLERRCTMPDSELKVVERQMSETDREIDQLVYRLYDLTADEVRAVEAATAE